MCRVVKKILPFFERRRVRTSPLIPPLTTGSIEFDLRFWRGEESREIDAPSGPLFPLSNFDRRGTASFPPLDRVLTRAWCKDLLVRFWGKVPPPPLIQTWLLTFFFGELAARSFPRLDRAGWPVQFVAACGIFPAISFPSVLSRTTL